ncbi:MAG: hypothetical protein IIA59_00405 [Candidatus Marinimicrobia bacterium]|nr:hypothetical protein [Candidatus Neomarinimicrobiota bacterium]
MRKLTAIMFTDIAGFTALSAEDEAAALVLLDKQRELLKPIVEEYGGSWLKEMGDGLLISFSSSHRALDCAVRIQEAVQDIENLNLRIGIHQGDVIEQDGDVLGDDVNIASRIEPFAAVGGVAVSDKVYRDISGDTDFSATYLGRPKLKGVKQDVGVYSVTSHGLPETRLADVAAKLEREPKRWRFIAPAAMAAFALMLYLVAGRGSKINSIALLPFADETGLAGQEYLVSGMYDGLLGELSKISALRVISRRSAMQYLHSDKSITQIAKELNVDALLEAVVIQTGDSIGLRLQLVQTRPTERNLWSQEYRRTISRAYFMYSEIALALAEKISIKLTNQEEADLANADEVNPAAYEAYLRGRFHSYGFTAPDFELAIKYYEESLNIAPKFAKPQAGISMIWASRKVLAIGSPFEAMREERKAARAAVKMDSTQSEAHRIMAILHAWTDWDWPAAEAAFKKAIAINPSNADAHIFYGHFLNMMLRPEESSVHMERAMLLDPLNSFFRGLYAIHLNMMKKYERAITQAQMAINVAPNYPLPYLAKWSAHMAMGEPDDGLEAATAYLHVLGYESIVGDMSEGFAREGYRGAMRIAADKLAAEAENQYIKPFAIGYLYAHSRVDDLAFEWFNKAKDVHDPAMAYLSAFAHANVFPDAMRKDPRFTELLRSSNLPE